MGGVTSVFHSCAKLHSNWDVTQDFIHADNYLAEFSCCVKH